MCHSAKPSTLARRQVIFGSPTVIASSSWHTTLLKDHFTRNSAARLFREADRHGELDKVLCLSSQL